MTDTLTLAAQYFFEWESFRYPEGGTYLGPVDFAFNGPDRQFLVGPASASPRAATPSEPKQHGDWGLAARWSPQWLDGTLGFYYRNFSDKLPQTFITAARPGSAALQPDLRRQHQPVRHQPGQEHRRRQPRRRAVVPQQHAAEQPGAGHRARPAGAGRDQGPARRHRARPGQRARRDPADAAVRRRHLGRRADLGAPGVGEERRQPVQRRGLRAVHANATAPRQGQVGRLRHQQLRRHLRSRSRRPGTRCSRAWTCRCRWPTRSACRATRRRSSAATRATATTASAWASTCTRSTAST